MDVIKFKGVKVDKRTGEMSMKRSAKSIEIVVKHCPTSIKYFKVMF